MSKYSLPVNYSLFKSPSDLIDAEKNPEIKQIKLVKCEILNTTEYEVFSFYKSISTIINPNI